MCYPIFWAGGFDLTSTLDLGYVCMRQAVVDAGGKLPSIFRGWPVKNGCTLSSMTTAIFWDTTLHRNNRFAFHKGKKNRCKKWKCPGSTYFKSKFWYNREFSLCYVDKLVQIWFLSLPWQLLDISIFLRDFFLLLNNTCLIQICLDLMCAHKETFITCRQKSLMIENDFYQSYLVGMYYARRVLPILTPHSQFSPTLCFE